MLLIARKTCRLKKSQLAFFFFLTFAACLHAQLLPSTPAAAAKTPTDSLNRETPSGTVFGFLEAAQSGKYSIAAQYLQMSPARRQSEGESLAQQLKIVMDRALSGSLKNVSTQPEGRVEEGGPPDRQHLGTMSSGDVEDDLVLARVNDASAGKIWLISSETLLKVPELYDQVEARQVESKLPRWAVKRQLLGMPLWQWIALVLAIPVAAGVSWLLLVVLQVPLRWWARRHGHTDIENMRSVSGPAWLLAGTLLHRIFAAYLGMPLLQRHYYTQLTAVAVIIGGNWILWRVIRWFLHRVRLVELTASALNVELVCYVLTTNFDEFAAVREEILLRIMNLVEDSGASLASSQTMILRSEPEPQPPRKEKPEKPAK
jgi:MscS family membrane protein